MSEIQIYTEPVEGVRASYNRRDMLLEIGEIVGFEPDEYELDTGYWNSAHLVQVLEFLGEDPGCDRSRAEYMKDLKELVDLDMKDGEGFRRSMSDMAMWEILEVVKDEQ